MGPGGGGLGAGARPPPHGRWGGEGPGASGRLRRSRPAVMGQSLEARPGQGARGQPAPLPGHSPSCSPDMASRPLQPTTPAHVPRPPPAACAPDLEGDGGRGERRPGGPATVPAPSPEGGGIPGARGRRLLRRPRRPAWPSPPRLGRGPTPSFCLPLSVAFGEGSSPRPPGACELEGSTRQGRGRGARRPEPCEARGSPVGEGLCGPRMLHGPGAGGPAAGRLRRSLWEAAAQGGLASRGGGDESLIGAWGGPAPDPGHPGLVAR